jgi:hypothetical protein
MTRKLNGLMQQLRRHPQNLGLLKKILSLIGLLKELPFAVNLWRVENLYYQISRTTYPELVATGQASTEWSDNFLELGRALRIRVENIPSVQLALAS